MTVIKCGGSSLSQLSASFAAFVAAWQEQDDVVLVHGGGPAIHQLEQRLQLKSSFNSCGQRITNEETLEVVIQALCGSLNSQLSALLTANGVEAIGLSGLSASLLQARLKNYRELGWVGEIVKVRSEILQMLCHEGFVPVIAPVSLHVPALDLSSEVEAPPGQALNVNADSAASAIAAAIGAESMIFVSDIPGILNENKQLLREVNEAQIQRLIDAGVIYGGMLPKVEGALAALKNQCRLQRVYIMDGTSNNLPTDTLDTKDLSSRLYGTCIRLH